MISDLSAFIRQKSEDREKLANQRWADHDATHAGNDAQIDKAFNQANTALLAALEAHRREHSIAETAQTKADETHQQQHRALNELRDVVGDLTSRYVPLSSLSNITDSWERRWSERAKEFDSYREGLAKEQAAYRESIRVEIQHLRESRASGEGKGIGAGQVVAYMIAAVSVLAAIVGLAARFIGP